MTSDEVVANGTEAEALLASPIFERVVTEVRDDIARAILSSNPTDVEGREFQFRLSFALDAIIGKLRQKVSMRNNELLRLQYELENE